MSLFEFILVMVSLILAIGVTHLLRGVAAIVQNRETLQLDWVPLTWAASLFILSALHWWSLWDFRVVEWTFPDFFFVLLAPTFLYVAVSILVSPDLAAPGNSMAASFERVRLPFMVVMVALALATGWDGWVLGVEPAWNSLRIVQVGVIGTLLVGAASSKRVIQQCVAVAILGIFFVVAFVLRYLPNAFGPS